MIENLRAWATACRIDISDAKEVQISSGFKDLYDSFTWDFIEVKECYRNCAILCASKTNVEYCFGYAQAIIPIEHAWVCIDGKYYDPTLEKHSELGDAYLLLKKFNRQELLDFLDISDNVAPDLWTMVRAGVIKQKEFTLEDISKELKDVG